MTEVSLPAMASAMTVSVLPAVSRFQPLTSSTAFSVPNGIIVSMMISPSGSSGKLAGMTLWIAGRPSQKTRSISKPSQTRLT